jgi:ABC-type uncharacterized transport system fused permease/ATPase subunit
MGVWLEVQFNTWNRDFYNTFETRNQAEFFYQLGTFTLLAVIYIVNGVYRQYFQQMLMIEWRSWMTERFLTAWMRIAPTTACSSSTRARTTPTSASPTTSTSSST